MDRPDVQHACKEICRRMSSPRSRDWMLLKKLARYLVKHRRIAIDFRFQNDANFVDGYSDSDYAGCKDTRKSTTGGCMMIGTHTLRSWSRTQAVVAMSSAEAEFYAVVRCICELLGLHGLLRDLGMPMNIRWSQTHRPREAWPCAGGSERSSISKRRLCGCRTKLIGKSSR